MYTVVEIATHHIYWVTVFSVLLHDTRLYETKLNENWVTNKHILKNKKDERSHMYYTWNPDTTLRIRICYTPVFWRVHSSALILWLAVVNSLLLQWDPITFFIKDLSPLKACSVYLEVFIATHFFKLLVLNVTNITIITMISFCDNFYTAVCCDRYF